MEEKEVRKSEGPDSVVALAISGSKKSKYIVKWALEKFIPEGLVNFKLLHIRPLIARIPTPMGNFIPISQVREDVATAFRKEIEWQTNEKLLPYRRMCTQRKVQVEIVQIESDDVVNAIVEHISKNSIDKLVIGTSSRNLFSRTRKLSSRIAEACPTFCTVFAVSKGKLSSLRPSNSEVSRKSFQDDVSETSSTSTDNYTSQTLSSRTDWTDQGSMGSYSNYRSSSLPAQRFQALSAINQNLLHKRVPSNEVVHLKDLPVSTAGSSSNINDATSPTPSFMTSVPENLSWDQASASDASAQNQGDINFELEKLRIELRHIRGMYAMAQSEATDASRKLNDLQKRRLEEEINLKQMSIKEAEVEELARKVKERYESAKREAELVKDCVDREATERKEAEIRASRETKEKEKFENTLKGCFQRYRHFTWDEITAATSSFSDDLKIGMGAYGSVYKCSLLHTTAAVKILHSHEANKSKQFQQELEILSEIRHPHLLILLGACPERSCLIYEYMENGSLDDVLMKRTGARLQWFDRFRIAWEVASALVFLHNTKPKSIIHRDLKPANVLLDQNYVSKIGDVGLATMVNQDSLSVSGAAYKDTAPVGTMCYIDPEYQRTGIISPKSDVYAFGMVILQLLTGKHAVALAHKVEVAISNGCLTEVLDPEAGEWPSEETQALALIGLKCTEIRRTDRPDLEEKILPVLERLKDIAEKGRELALTAAPAPPKHFMCPILKEVMTDPFVAADGYTYDRKAIEEWLEANDTSPMTDSPLLHKFLVPNYTLLSAIMEWKSGKHEETGRGEY